MELQIEYMKVSELLEYKANTKIHDSYDVAQIRKSIEKYGFNDPIGIWSDKNIIVEGHGRLMAAKSLGMDTVPIIRLDHLTDEERREYGVIHNKTTELSQWDMVNLKKEIDELDFSDFDIDFGLPEDKDPVITERPEVQFSEVLGEENNYVILQFKNDIDWLQACTVLGIEQAKAASTRRDGTLTEKMTRIGTGRVLDGAEVLRKLEGNT